MIRFICGQAQNQSRKDVQAVGCRTTAHNVSREASGKKGDWMDVTAITQIVSTLGFPIAMCIYLLYRDGKRDEAHKEEMTKMTEAINNNTIALTQLTERMEKT